MGLRRPVDFGICQHARADETRLQERRERAGEHLTGILDHSGRAQLLRTQAGSETRRLGPTAAVLRLQGSGSSSRGGAG